MPERMVTTTRGSLQAKSQRMWATLWLIVAWPLASAAYQGASMLLGVSSPSTQVIALSSGDIVIRTSACPQGYTEVSALNGQTLVGTLNANGNAGTTGGADTLTPAGTNSAPTFTGSALGTHTHTFTGSALANHAHELPIQLSTTTQMRQIAAATFGTGTSRAATSQQTHTANTTSAAVALSQAVTAGTPAGTNAAITAGTPAGTVSAPVFTGTQFDNRSAFTRVIFCQRT